jgi:hypothetical protein
MEMPFEERGTKGVWYLWKTLAAKKEEGFGHEY